MNDNIKVNITVEVEGVNKRSVSVQLTQQQIDTSMKHVGNVIDKEAAIVVQECMEDIIKHKNTSVRKPTYTGTCTVSTPNNENDPFSSYMNWLHQEYSWQIKQKEKSIPLPDVYYKPDIQTYKFYKFAGHIIDKKDFEPFYPTVDLKQNNNPEVNMSRLNSEEITNQLEDEIVEKWTEMWQVGWDAKLWGVDHFGTDDVKDTYENWVNDIGQEKTQDSVDDYDTVRLKLRETVVRLKGNAVE